MACRPAGCCAEEDVHQVGQLVPRQGLSHVPGHSVFTSSPCLGCLANVWPVKMAVFFSVSELS